MAWLPPVSIPSLSDRNYASELYGMTSGVGEAVYQNRRDSVGDAMWEQEFAQKKADADRNYALELQRFEADQIAGDEFYAPQWAYDEANDQWGLVQPSKAGGQGSLVGMPEGYKPMPPTSNVNLGTAVQPVTTRGGLPTSGPLPVDVAGEKHQQEYGGAGGKIAATLPVIQASTQRLVTGIDELLQDPMLSSVTGPAGGRVPTWMSTDPGGASRAQSRIDFILGNTFLQAYNDLRGAGQITEREGQAAMEAYSRLRTQAMSDEDYAQALVDLRNEVVKLYAIAEQRARMGAPGEDTAPQPQGQLGAPMTTPGGVQFKRID